MVAGWQRGGAARQSRHSLAQGCSALGGCSALHWEQSKAGIRLTHSRTPPILTCPAHQPHPAFLLIQLKLDTHYVYDMLVYTQICIVKKGDFPDIKMYNWLDVRAAVCGALPVTCLELINHSLTPPLCLVPWILAATNPLSEIFTKYHFSNPGLAYALQVIRLRSQQSNSRGKTLEL